MFITRSLVVQCFGVLALTLLLAVFPGCHPFSHGCPWVFPHRQWAFPHGHKSTGEINIRDASATSRNCLGYKKDDAGDSYAGVY